MDFSKYNQVPTEPATAAQIGLAAATLSAMARRGLVEVIPGKPNKYRRIENTTIKIYQLLEENKNDFDEFFTLRKKDTQLGMLCYIKGGEIVDCWGKRYDLTDVCKIEFRTRSFDL
jgi:hypothetical protein